MIARNINFPLTVHVLLIKMIKVKKEYSRNNLILLMMSIKWEFEIYILKETKYLCVCYM